MRILIAGAVLLLAAGGAARADDFDAIRAQSAIATSYDFAPLPKNAGAGISIAILTTGVNPDVQKLLGARFQSVNLLSGESDADQMNIGTSSVSVLAALVPQAKIISIKVLDKDGQGGYTDIARGIETATALGAKIIVMGIGDNSGNTNEAVNKAVSAAVKGRIVVVSAGNSGGNNQVDYPANMDGVVAIGATDDEDKVQSYSNHGGKIIYAPGKGVLGLNKEAKLDTTTGTTCAALVAGAVYAVLWSQKPKLRAQDIISAVQQSAKSIDIDGVQGKRIDGAAALRSMSK